MYWNRARFWLYFPAFTVMLFGVTRVTTAQTVRGVVESDSGERVSGAVVTLLGKGDADLFSALSDPLGRFELRAPQPASYRLRVHRLGFGEHVTPVVEVPSAGRSDIRVILSTEAIQIEGLKVEVEAPIRTDPYLDRRGFYDRWKHWGIDSGWGRFYTRQEIEKMNAFNLIDIVRLTPGMREASAGGRSSFPTCRLGKRPSVYLNGSPVKYGYEFNTFLSPSEIDAIEIYPGFLGPMEYNPAGCVIVIWTGPGPRKDR